MSAREDGFYGAEIAFAHINASLRRVRELSERPWETQKSARWWETQSAIL